MIYRFFVWLIAALWKFYTWLWESVEKFLLKFIDDIWKELE
jgi:hypothetical protein